MALVNCPECGNEVSDNAGNCPKCGYGLSGGGTTQAQGGKIQTVEKTSKRLKLQTLLSFLLIIGSIVAIFVGTSAEEPGKIYGFATFGIVGGLIWFIIVRFLKWWHHA